MHDALRVCAGMHRWPSWVRGRGPPWAGSSFIICSWSFLMQTKIIDCVLYFHFFFENVFIIACNFPCLIYVFYLSIYTYGHGTSNGNERQRRSGGQAGDGSGGRGGSKQQNYRNRKCAKRKPNTFILIVSVRSWSTRNFFWLRQMHLYCNAHSCRDPGLNMLCHIGSIL